MGSAMSIARRTLLLTMSNLALRAVSMLFQVYLTGQVGAAGIGLLQLVLTVHAFAITVGTSGLRVAAMYLPAEEYGHRRFGGVRQAMLWCLGAGTVLSTLVGAAMAVGAQALALCWVRDLRATASLRLLGLTLPLTCLSAILAGYFTACNQIRRLVLVEMGDRLATVVLTVWLLQRGNTADVGYACVAIVGGGALASGGSVAVLFWMLRKDLRRFDRRGEVPGMGRRLAELCVPVAFNDYLRAGLGTLEQFLIPYGLARCGGSRAAALADYGTIHGMVFPVLMFSSTVLFAVSDLLVPELARCRAEGNRLRITHLTQTCLRMGMVFSALVAGFLWLLARPLGMLLYKSSAAGSYLRLFAPLVPFLYLDCIVDGMHKGMGQQIYCVRVNTLTNLMDVVFLWILLPRYGIGGYYVTYVVTHLVNFGLSLRRLLQYSGPVRLCHTVVAGAGCVAAAMVFTQFFVPMANRWSSVLLGGGVYMLVAGLLLCLSGSWRREDSRHLRQMFGRE